MPGGAVLLVEDNADDEILTLEAFKETRIANAVVVVRDGVEALDYLMATGKFASRDSRDLPELILLDLKLPKITGLDVLKHVRANEKTRRLPIVILTSSDEERDIVESYNNGANSYIRKPVDSENFTEAVREIGLYWLLLNLASPR